MSKKAVIFDMDGVLVDSEPIYMQRFYEFFKYHDQDVNILDIYKVIGTSDHRTYEMLGELWTPVLSSEDFYDSFSKHQHNIGFEFTDLLFPHVHYLMRNLKKNDIELGLASASPRKNIEAVLEQNNLKDYLTFTISGEEVYESKPNPEVYLQTMKNLGVKPENTIIIEDSPSGITAATKSGATVIAIKDNRFSLDQTHADYHATDIMDAYNIIVNLHKL